MRRVRREDHRVAGVRILIGLICRDGDVRASSFHWAVSARSLVTVMGELHRVAVGIGPAGERVAGARCHELRDLLVPIFVNGSLVYDCPSLQQIREYSEAELDTLWDEIKRFTYPQTYYVDLSKKLLDLKLKMLEDVNRQ